MLLEFGYYGVARIEKTNGGFDTVAKYVCQSLLKWNVFIIF